MLPKTPWHGVGETGARWDTGGHGAGWDSAILAMLSSFILKFEYAIMKRNYQAILAQRVKDASTDVCLISTVG